MIYLTVVAVFLVLFFLAGLPALNNRNRYQDIREMEDELKEKGQ